MRRGLLVQSVRNEVGEPIPGEVYRVRLTSCRYQGRYIILVGQRFGRPIHRWVWLNGPRKGQRQEGGARFEEMRG